MIKAFSVRWLESDDTKIKYTEEFNSCGYVLQLDIIKDTIAMLEERYDAILLADRSKWTSKYRGRKNATI